ncbi:MAG: hypothetical protein Q9181_007913, partial [Wetmoreana brouardii]
LPEDRFIVVESQMGLVPMVVWAHYILGLTVLIKNSPDGDVAVGRMGKPQVIIKWSSTFFSTSSLSNLDHMRWFSQPTIYLLDADMNVLLETKPNPIVRTEIEGQEFHRLKGYGTTFLRRLFNSQTLVADDDPIFTETASFAVSFSILLSRAMRRLPHPVKAIRRRNDDIDVPKQCYLGTEHWRLFDSSDLLFRGIKLDKRKISEYLEEISGKKTDDMAFPTSVRNYLQKLDQNTSESTRLTFLGDIKRLASWILSFAQVVDIESCADLPLRMAPKWTFGNRVQHWNGLDQIDIPSDVWFEQIVTMMRRDVNIGSGFVGSRELFLTCHQGWSLFYSCVGDHDPGEINCELLSIKRGVPTNTRTGERKYQITDAPSIEENLRTPKILDKGDSYLPRCVTKVYKRTEHYSSRSEAFWLSIRFDIEEVDFHRQTLSQRAGQDQRYSLYASHSQFHEGLWGVVKTIPCHHRNEDCGPLPLDQDAMTVTGLTWANGDGDAVDTRICICLVKGDARARWLVVNGIFSNGPGA